MSSEDVMWKQAAAQIARLQEENTRLRAALQPFADAAKDEGIIEAEQGESLYFPIYNQFGRPEFFLIEIDEENDLEVRHLRAAAKALGNE